MRVSRGWWRYQQHSYSFFVSYHLCIPKYSILLLTTCGIHAKQAHTPALILQQTPGTPKLDFCTAVHAFGGALDASCTGASFSSASTVGAPQTKAKLLKRAILSPASCFFSLSLSDGDEKDLTWRATTTVVHSTLQLLPA